MEREFSLAENNQVMNVDIEIEPFDLKIGFWELVFFMQLKDIMNDFVSNLNNDSSVKEAN